MASIEPSAGEIWIVDFGTTAKQRPVVVLAFPQPQDARALVVVAPLTSQVRGLEIGVSVHFLSFFLKPIDGKLIVEGI